MRRPHDDPTYLRNRARLKRRASLTGEPCWRCGLPIDYTAQRGDPRAFTAGHVLAVADGGSHDLTNLEPEHARCNASTGGQLGNARRWQNTRPVEVRVPSRDW